MSAAIRFEHVTKRFVLQDDRPRSFKEAFVDAFRSRRAIERRSLTALDDVSFDVAHGESVGLVGPNGTGKSTSLKIVAGILEPTAGRVVVDGRVAALLELGAGFHPDLSGRENVYLNGSLLGLSRRAMRERLDRIVDFSELGRFIDMPVKHYSSGMYMRLGFATSIHVDADILLVDEVLAVGDQAFQNKCRERIARLRAEGITILLVSHDTQAVRELCRRAIWLENGRILGQGRTDDVLESYYASVVARESQRFAAEGAGPEMERAPAPAPEGRSGRFGTGEVEIERVEVVDDAGAPLPILLTGEPATVRLHYRARTRVERPVFGIAIHRDDGVHVAGPNTFDARLDIEAVEGVGVVDVRIARLPLVDGAYELSAACYDETLSHPYDHHHRRFPLRVRAGTGRERFGLIALDARWTHRPGGGGRARDEAPAEAPDESGEASDVAGEDLAPGKERPRAR